MLNVDLDFLLIYFLIDSSSTLMTVILTMTMMIVRMNSTVILICTMMTVMTMTMMILIMAMMIGRRMTVMIQMMEKDVNIYFYIRILLPFAFFCRVFFVIYSTDRSPDILTLRVNE